MDKNYTTELLEEEARKARELYDMSHGSEWLQLIITLKALIEKYTSNKQFEKAFVYNKEIEDVLNSTPKMNVAQLSSQVHYNIVNKYYDEIREWSTKAEKYKKELNHGVSCTNYANTIYSLCEYLCLVGLNDIAFLKYEEAIQILLSEPFNLEDDQDRLYTTIVTFLKASICADKIGKDNLARFYSVYSLFYLTKNIDKLNPYTCWNYVTELCNEIINKTTG